MELRLTSFVLVHNSFLVTSVHWHDVGFGLTSKFLREFVFQTVSTESVIVFFYSFM